MNSDDVPVLKAWIRCAVCAIEVPLDEAVVPETTDRLILPLRVRLLCALARRCSYFLSIAFTETGLGQDLSEACETAPRSPPSA